MLLRVAVHVTSGLLAVFFGFSVAAQQHSPSIPQGMKQGDVTSFNEQISGCTAALQRPIVEPTTRALCAIVYMQRASAYRAAGDYDDAIADFSKAIEVHPDDTLAYFWRGEAQTDKKDYDRAIADYSEVIRLEPKFGPAYFKRGSLYNEKKDFDRAIADYSEVIRLYSSGAEAYSSRGIAVRLHPIVAEAYGNRGIAYERKGNPDRAISDFRQALEIAPNHQNSREALERLSAKR
jgi:tetratricopeptide (TPR) repeat protein